ncbi:MAG: ABC transporter permease [Lawsonibacter sp.]
MQQMLVKRILTACVQIFAVATIVFFVMHSMPGRTAKLMLELDGGSATEEQIVALEEKLGLDQPISVQYVNWIRNLVTFQVGDSFYYSQPVTGFIAQRLPATLELAVTSTAMAIVLGLFSGILSALYHGKAADKLVTGCAVLGFSIPNFVMGTLLILIFGLTLGVLPTSGYVKISRSLIMHLKFLVLPSLTLALGMSAGIARVTRSSLLDEVNREYIQALRSKGLAPRLIFFRHALKNALIPIITVIGLHFGTLLGGTVVVEQIFNWPGLSSLVVESIQHRDYPMIQTAVVVIAAIYILVNNLIELSFGIIDPKMKRGLNE